MRTAVDYAQHATECRRLASECTKPEHWEHFLEMAETWEQLGKKPGTKQQAQVSRDTKDKNAGGRAAH